MERYTALMKKTSIFKGPLKYFDTVYKLWCLKIKCYIKYKVSGFWVSMNIAMLIQCLGAFMFYGHFL